MIHPALAGLLERYQPQSANDYQNAVREIVQEIALLGLWRTPLDEVVLRERLAERFSNIDFAQAKDDIRPFLKDPRETALWSEEFFMKLIPMIPVVG